jgi:hypothetical protein
MVGSFIAPSRRGAGDWLPVPSRLVVYRYASIRTNRVNPAPGCARAANLLIQAVEIRALISRKPNEGIEVLKLGPPPTSGVRARKLLR